MYPPLALHSSALVGTQLMILLEAPHFACEPQECASDFPKRWLNSFSPSRVWKALRSSAATEHFACAPQPLMPQHLMSVFFSSAASLATGPLRPMLIPATAAIRNCFSRLFIVFLLLSGKSPGTTTGGRSAFPRNRSGIRHR